MSRTLTVAWGSLAVSAVVLALKFAAYWLTGSVALHSDALETIINVVAAGGALIAVWVSKQPADANDPYGHHKAEYLSAVVEGALVLATAFLIAHEAWVGFEHPHAPDAPIPGLLLNAAGGVLNLLWARAAHPQGVGVGGPPPWWQGAGT
jgi:cation diffusion facilitator family transporter